MNDIEDLVDLYKAYFDMFESKHYDINRIPEVRRKFIKHYVSNGSYEILNQMLNKNGFKLNKKYERYL